MARIQPPPLISEYGAEQRDKRWCRRIALALPILFLARLGMDLLDERLRSNAGVLGISYTLLQFNVSWAWIILSLASIPVSLKAIRYGKRRAWGVRLICCAALAFGLFAIVYSFLEIGAHEGR